MRGARVSLFLSAGLLVPLVASAQGLGDVARSAQHT